MLNEKTINKIIWIITGITSLYILYVSYKGNIIFPSISKPFSIMLLSIDLFLSLMFAGAIISVMYEISTFLVLLVYTISTELLNIFSNFYNKKDTTTNFNNNTNQEYAQKEQKLHQEFEYAKEKMRQEFQEEIDEMERQYQEAFERQQQEYERENQRENNKTYAEILGVAENASKAEIKAAYRRKMQSFHPDKNPNITPEVAQMLKEQAQKINQAYEFLMQTARD